MHPVRQCGIMSNGVHFIFGSAPYPLHNYFLIRRAQIKSSGFYLLQLF